MTNIPHKEGELIKEGPDVSASFSDPKLFEEFMPGQYVIGPKGMKIMNSLYIILNEYITTPLSFDEVMLPKIAPVETFRKADIIGRWDDYLLSVRPFSETNGVEEEYILDPLQCTSFYQFLENKSVDMIKWYDRSGPSYRNEDSDKIIPGVKQLEFHRAEYIYLGEKEEVVEAREQCVEQLEELCDELGLRYRIVVGTGCYHLKDGEIDSPKSLEEIPIKDIEVLANDKWIELAGCSILGNVMTSRFNINSGKAWSGCMGIGMERFLYIVAGYGGVNG